MRSPGQQQSSKRIEVIGAVGRECGRGGRGQDEVGGDRRVATLARCDDEGDEATEPIDEGVLFARLRSLTRLKVMIDELREREETSRRMGMAPMLGARLGASCGRILVVDDDPERARALADDLAAEHRPVIETEPDKALMSARGPIDLAVINIAARGFDALRLVARLRSGDHSR